MKKVSIFMAIAAAASLASCTAQAPKANLKSDIDSLSYSIGMAQTQGLKGYLTGRLNVDIAYMAEFIKGLNDGVSKTSKKDIAYMAGIQIGQQISGENGMIKTSIRNCLPVTLLKLSAKTTSWPVSYTHLTQPGITWLTPNTAGSPRWIELSNRVPSTNVPS